MKGRCLAFVQRDEISIRRAQGQSLRPIAEAVGCSASTVSRELRRNSKPGQGYRATSAHVLAYERVSRPKPAKLHTNTALRAIVEEDLAKKARFCRSKQHLHRALSRAGHERIRVP